MITRMDIYRIIKNLDVNKKLLTLCNDLHFIWCYARLGLYFKLIATYSESFPSDSYKKVSIIKNIFYFFLKLKKIKNNKEQETILFITRLKKNNKTECFNDQIIGDTLNLIEKEKELILITQEQNEKFFKKAFSIDIIHSIIKIFSIFYVFNIKILYNAFLLSKICSNDVPLNFFVLFKTFLKSLIFASAQKTIYMYIFKKIKPKKIFLTDFCSHLGAINAAQSLGIESIDIQHGMFGPNDPTYSWPNLPKEKMPIPEKLIVWGDWWVQALSLQKTWENKDIYTSPPAYLADLKRTHKNKKNEKIKILFATQWVARNHSISFIINFLNIVKKQNIDIEFLIKLHPADMSFKNLFIDIEKKFKNICFVIDFSVDTYELILNSSVVVSYASTILIESIILEIPAISICCSTMQGGFNELFNFSENINKIHHIYDEYQLLNFIQNNFLDEDQQKKILNKNIECSNFLFKDDGMNLYKRIIKWKLM